MEEMMERQELRKTARKKMTIFDLKRSYAYASSYADQKYEEECSSKYISRYKPTPAVKEFYNQVAATR